MYMQDTFITRKIVSERQLTLTLDCYGAMSNQVEEIISWW